ncbi:hypothetical protein F5877DRAFT_86442 [Lentinula edodes]|nr:hypothetical protein F5877DRAFT_86442 [Lentinula edodes]
MVFLKLKSSSSESTSRVSRPWCSDIPGGIAMPGSPLSIRPFSDYMNFVGPPSSEVPFEDLHRRLATINGSAASLSLAPQTPTAPRSSLPSHLPQPSPALASGAISPVPVE